MERRYGRSRRGALGLVLAIGLAGCSQDASAPTPSAPDTEDAPSATEPAASETTAAAEGPCAEIRGIDDERIVVGQIMGLSGPFAGVAEAINAGLDAYVAAVNEDGGIDGRTIEIRRLDHEYDQSVAVQRFQDLESEVAVLISHGTQPTNAILPDIDEACLPTLIFGQGGVNALSDYTYIYGAPYAYAATNGLEWAVEEKAATGSWGIIYQNDVVGDEILQATRFAADQLGVELVSEASFALGDSDFTAQVRQLREAGAEWVMLAAFPPASIQIVGEAVAQGAEFSWMAPNVGWAGELTYPTEATALMASVDFYQSNYVSGWNSSDDAVLTEAKETITAHADVEGQLPFLGYAGAMMLVEHLEQAVAGGDLSRQGLAAAIAAVGEVETGELFCGIAFGDEGQPHNPSRGSMILSIEEGAAPDGYVREAPCFVGDVASAFQLSSLS